MDSDSLIVVFDDGGAFVVYESTADLEASMEPAMAAEEPYSAFTLKGFVVDLSARGNLASNATTLAIVSSRQDRVRLQTCLQRVRPFGGSDIHFTDLETLVNHLWEYVWTRQQAAWWNMFGKRKLLTSPRRV